MRGVCDVAMATGIYLTCLLLLADMGAEVEVVDGVGDREAPKHLTPLTLIGISKSYVAA